MLSKIILGNLLSAGISFAVIAVATLLIRRFLRRRMLAAISTAPTATATPRAPDTCEHCPSCWRAVKRALSPKRHVIGFELCSACVAMTHPSGSARAMAADEVTNRIETKPLPEPSPE